MKYLTLFSLLLVLGCSANAYPEFKVVDSIKILSDGAPNNEALGGDFLPYLHPVAQIPNGPNTVLIGYIKYEEEYHKGVAYLVHRNHVLDSLVLSILDPPGDQWAEVGSNIVIHKHNETIEPVPDEVFEPGFDEKHFSDLKMLYSITEKGFVWGGQ